ncbi:MAG: ATP-binding protein [Caulobacteraceae bacterium]
MRVSVPAHGPPGGGRGGGPGAGVPPDNLETVFERFYTARPRARRSGGHSGLGLSIARQIVVAHGGASGPRTAPTPTAGDRRALRGQPARSAALRPAGEVLHAGLVALRVGGDWRGALIVGESGAGKSDLMLRASAKASAWWPTTDDRTLVWADEGAVFGRAPDTLRGLIEARGLGILDHAALPMSPVGLVARCAAGARRYGADAGPTLASRCKRGASADRAERPGGVGPLQTRLRADAAWRAAPSSVKGAPARPESGEGA